MVERFEFYDFKARFQILLNILPDICHYRIFGTPGYLALPDMSLPDIGHYRIGFYLINWIGSGTSLLR